MYFVVSFLMVAQKLNKAFWRFGSRTKRIESKFYGVVEATAYRFSPNFKMDVATTIPLIMKVLEQQQGHARSVCVDP